MNARTLRSRPFLLLAAALFVAPARADRVVTDDGRVLTPLRAREQGQGYLLEFNYGDVELPDKRRVKAVEIEGNMADYVPQNDDERKKLAEGYIKYKGRWYSKPAYEDELAKEHAESKARADDMAAHSDFDSAWTKETKHFVVRTNTSPQLLDTYCELLEGYYSLMDDRFGIKPSPTLRRAKMDVNIYKSRREFHKLNKAGVGGGVAGYFSPTEQSLNFYYDYSEPGITNWVALHECTHLLTYLIEPQYMPQPEIWLNEAVADFFGSSTIERDKKGKLAITPGRLQTDRVLTVQQAIKVGNDVKLADLFNIKRNQFHAFEYAHAWSFVYFLNQSKPEYRKAFDRFFKDIYTLNKRIEFETVPHYDKSGRGQHVTPQEMRRVVLDSLKCKDIEVLEKEWKAFIAAIPIEGAEARFKRAYSMILQGQINAESQETIEKGLEEARADLDAAIEAGITDPRAWWARSKVLLFRGQSEDARADLSKAIEMDPLSAVYRYEMGMLLAGGPVSIGGVGLEADSEDKEFNVKERPEAEPFLGMATELAPDNETYRRTLARYLKD